MVYISKKNLHCCCTRWVVMFSTVLFSLTSIAENAPRPKMVPTITPEERICFALYTVHERTLKLTAQFYPIQDSEPFEAELQIKRDGVWKQAATTEIFYPGYTASFRIENWDDRLDHEYRVVHNPVKDKPGEWRAKYEGLIRKNPTNKDELILAAFSCNSIYPNHGGDISREDIVNNLLKIKPDVLFFAGDQVYTHSNHYLEWLKFGKDFGPLIRNTPTITIPDDHDIGQGNLWGAGGIKCNDRNGNTGGYYMPISYIQEVERAQTSHLPDPYDPTPIARGLGVYYTDYVWGGISFAIIEDRKFKTGPGAEWEKLENPEAILLGDRQIKFLEDWATDWTNAEMKCVLSQTVFAQTNNRSGKHDNILWRDADTNGWPVHGRNRALRAIRKGYACMVAGDQHLATVVHHGIDEWGDAGVSFASPAIANFWLRWWKPEQPGANRKPNQPETLGDFKDGFGNKMTMMAVANPTAEEISEGGYLSTRAAGYGLVRYNKPKRTITFECWPRNVDATKPDSKQYSHWPITVTQEDNFPLKNGLEMPTLKISKEDQVVTVINEANNEVVSSIRIKGTTWQPRVRKKGNYTIVVGEGDHIKRYQALTPATKNQETLLVNLSE